MTQCQEDENFDPKTYTNEETTAMDTETGQGGGLNLGKGEKESAKDPVSPVEEVTQSHNEEEQEPEGTEPQGQEPVDVVVGKKPDSSQPEEGVAIPRDNRSPGDGESEEGKANGEKGSSPKSTTTPPLAKPESDVVTPTSPDSQTKVPPTRVYTKEELALYNGTGEYRQILLGINGKVFDVTAGRQFYGPGGAYAMFSGRDATRALCMFEINPSDDPVDPETLTPIQKESLFTWERFYLDKYKWIGVLKQPKVTPVSTEVKPKADDKQRAQETESKYSCACYIL